MNNRISVKINFLFNLLNKGVAILLPLIMTPYITRVLTAKSLGLYTYSTTIASYFVTFILMGMGMYGSRLISQTKDNYVEFEKSYSKLITVQVINAFFAIFVYVIYLFLGNFENKIIFSIQLLYIVSACFDVSWFFSGIENFIVMAVRNVIINIVSVVLIFTLVKDENDLWIYVFIKAGSVFLSQIYLFSIFFRNFNYRVPRWKDIINVYRGLIVLFIPVLFDSIFQTIDRLMLATTSYENVGLYYSSRMITDIPQTFITSLNIILFPRISSLIAKKNQSEAEDIFRYSLVLIVGFCIIVAFGIRAISFDFVSLFFGKSYQEVAIYLPVLSIYIFLAAWSSTIRYQYLLPRSLDKIYVIAIVISVFVNIGLNYFLIPKLAIMGAIYATLISEFVICLYETYFVRRKIFNKEMVLNLALVLGIALLMYLGIKYSREVFVDKFSPFILVASEVLMGGFISSVLIGGYLIFINKKLLTKFKRVFK